MALLDDDPRHGDVPPADPDDPDALRREVAALRACIARRGDRAARLQRVAAHLSRSLTEDEVAAAIIDEGTDALGASAGGLWQMSDDGTRLALVRSCHYPDEAIALVRMLPMALATPVTDAARSGSPVWLASRGDYAERYPASAARTDGMAQPAAYATAALPLMLDGRCRGALALTFVGDRAFDEDDRGFLELLAWHCAQGFERARLYAAEHAARRIAEIAQERAVFLSRASALLGSSLDYEETLRNVAQLAVPHLADWCGVELVDPDLGSRQVAVAHVDPAKVELARELRRRYPPDPDAAYGVPNVIRTGQPELYPDIPDEMLVAGAIDAEHLRISRALGLRSAIIAPIRDGAGVRGAITFVAAESGRRYTPDDLRMAEQLGERAGVAIANAGLFAQVKRAVALRDDFLTIAGHELRTPVTAMSLHLQSLARISDDAPVPKVRERIGKLLAQGDRLVGLIEDLLDVTKLTAGRVEVHPEALDLAAVIGDTAERMRDDFERAGTPLVLDLAAVSGTWDRARLDQIATNLLGNALKYGKGQPVTVTVAVAPAGDGATLTVADRGIGIAAADHARIFERFERAVSSRNFGGFGLGLWIVRQLVEAHGGAIAVASAPGAGATFTVTLPLAAPA